MQTINELTDQIMDQINRDDITDSMKRRYLRQKLVQFGAATMHDTEVQKEIMWACEVAEG